MTKVAKHPEDTATMLSHEPVVEVRGLRKSYGTVEVLKGIDLTAKKGTVTSLVGSSGSGKSTLLRCLNLLENSHQGSIKFQGREVAWTTKGRERYPASKEQTQVLRTNLSMVFQQFNLWAHMTVLENLLEAPISVLKLPYNDAKDRADKYLEKVGIAEKATMYPNQLSGGQQQRVAIARALCMEPEAILFDEPTSALDPELKQEVVEVIRSLAFEGRTMIVVTHDMKMARDISTNVIFLHQGQIEEESDPKEFFENPKSERLRTFLSAISP